MCNGCGVAHRPQVGRSAILFMRPAGIPDTLRAFAVLPPSHSQVLAVTLISS
jgi:hypothetical protein